MGLKLRRSALNIDLILGSNVDLFYQLKNMELDAILVSLNDSVSDPDCEHLPLFSDDIFLAVPVDSPYARLAEIDLSTLRDTPFVTLTQASPPIRTAPGCSSRPASNRRSPCR